MANKIIRESEKNVVETMKEIMAQPNMECGFDEIEFPDGTKETFFYNGETDRQAAIKFATICTNATSDTPKAKAMMYTCFALMVKGVCPERIITLNEGIDLYLDTKKKALYDDFGNEFVALTEDEKKEKLSTNALVLILKERAERKLAEIRAAEAETEAEYEDYDEYEDEEDYLDIL